MKRSLHCVLVTGISFLALFSSPSRAGISISREIDHVNGGVALIVKLTATDYQPYVQEDYLTIHCNPDGSAYFSWHVDSRYSDDVDGLSGVEYRFEGGIAQSEQLGAISVSHLPSFYEALQNHKRLFLQFEGSHGSSVFILSGFKAVAGYSTKMGKQCAVALGSPNASQVTPGKKN